MSNCGFNSINRQLPKMKKKKYKSLYLGMVDLDLKTRKLEVEYKGTMIKIIDAQQYGLKANRRYSLESLKLLKGAQVVSGSAEVDIFFCIKNYIDFYIQLTGKTELIKGNILVALFNLNIDNAYYTGGENGYLIFGNGKRVFNPMVSPDTIGHELSHVLTNKLFYQGESGAINESISDCVGTAFEFFLYNRFNTDNDPYNDLTLLPNYTIGEGVVIKKSALRSLENPQLFKQPSKYQGKYWVNPKRLDFDKGGVHINSGVLNHLFYLLSQEMTVKKATELFYRVLQRLTPNCTFKEFSDSVKNLCHYEDYQIIIKSLRKISL
jgi:Zn-dependent metalloprotease